MKTKIFILFIAFLQLVPFITGKSLKAQGTPASGKLIVASCQFPVSADISANYNWIRNQIIEAKLKKADIVHFPECALSGYPGIDLDSLDGYDWPQLHVLIDSVLDLALRLKIWVIMGSMHQLTNPHLPHNSLYVISNEGKIIDRYDKRFCTSGDLNFFSPGDHLVFFDLNGVKCGLLICYDVRFFELFREYKKAGVNLIFHSFHNARQKTGSIHPVIMPVTAQANAGANYFFMSLTNSSAAESWPCHFITPDGLIQNKLTKNEPGMLISVADLSVTYYDASKNHRDNALKGILNSGSIVRDPRSENRAEH